MKALPPPHHESAPPSSKEEERKKPSKEEGKEEGQDVFQEMEPKVRQRIKVVGRTLFCFRCEGSKEMAGYYCACGSFLCSLHLAEHSCLVSASLQYNEEVMQALA